MVSNWYLTPISSSVAHNTHWMRRILQIVAILCLVTTACLVRNKLSSYRRSPAATYATRANLWAADKIHRIDNASVGASVRDIHKSGGAELAPQGCLIYTMLGESFEYQPYIWMSLRQARLFNPDVSIYLISSATTFDNAETRSMLDVLTIVAVDYSTLTHPLLDRFRAAFFVQGSMSPDGNENFNQYTSERIFAVFALMHKLDLQNVIHLENDNLIYSPIGDLIHAMKLCDVRFAVPFPTVGQAVVGSAYFKDAESVMPFVRFATEVFEMGQTKAVEFMGTEWINDMSVLGRFYKENSLSFLVSELPSKLYANRQKFEMVEGDENVFLSPLTFREAHPHSCIAEALPNTIFDSCVLGQFFGGTYGNPSVPHWEDNRQLDPRHMKLWWKQSLTISAVPIRVPFVDNIRILSLHVHSKQLGDFVSCL